MPGFLPAGAERGGGNSALPGPEAVWWPLMSGNAGWEVWACALSHMGLLVGQCPGQTPRPVGGGC